MKKSFLAYGNIALLRNIVRFLFVFSLSSFLLILILTHYALLPAGTEKIYIKFRIKEGIGASLVAKDLEKARIIKSALAFRLLIKYTKSDSKIKAGYYNLSPHLYPVEIIHKFVKGEVVTQKVVIPEGYSAAQIANLLNKKGVTTKEKFLKAVKNHMISFSMPYANFKSHVKSNTNSKINSNSKNSENINESKNTYKDIKEDIIGAEGFLFPDTYHLTWDMDPNQVVEILIGQFKNKVFSEYLKYDGPFSISKVVILASLVEREARMPNERPIIAKVFINRLKAGMQLECDATIQYVLEQTNGKGKELLTFDDLKIKSPYNTYLHGGLPPGAIGNPGLASIKAVLRPAKSNYLFYVTSGNNGSHRFSSSYEEHEKAVSQYKEFLRRQRNMAH